MNFRLLRCSWTHQIEMGPDFQTNTICIEGNTWGLIFQRAQWAAAATERATGRFSKSSNSQCTEIFGKAPIICSSYVEYVFFIFLINKIFWVKSTATRVFWVEAQHSLAVWILGKWRCGTFPDRRETLQASGTEADGSPCEAPQGCCHGHLKTLQLAEASTAGLILERACFFPKTVTCIILPHMTVLVVASCASPWRRKINSFSSDRGLLPAVMQHLLIYQILFFCKLFTSQREQGDRKHPSYALLKYGLHFYCCHHYPFTLYSVSRFTSLFQSLKLAITVHKRVIS